MSTVEIYFRVKHAFLGWAKTSLQSHNVNYLDCFSFDKNNFENADLKRNSTDIETHPAGNQNLNDTAQRQGKNSA